MRKSTKKSERRSRQSHFQQQYSDTQKQKRNHSSRMRQSKPVSDRVSHMTTRIRDLEVRLAETLTQLESAGEDAEEETEEILETEPDTVTTCVIKICTKVDTSRLSDHEPNDDSVQTEAILKAPPSFYRHPFPEGFRYQSIVPRSRADWLQFLVWLVKQRLIIKHLTDSKLKRVIEIARGQIGRLPPYEACPDIPNCYYWDEQQVAEWVADVGFPELQNVFLENFINGRRLVGIDASALNKMGIQNWKTIQEMARNIRCMFGLSRPNIMRPLAKTQPFETFLTKRRIHNGRTYDLLTFKQFCKLNDYDYEEVIDDQVKTAYTCALPDRHVIDAPSVEFQVRHQFVRSQTLEKIINDIIQLVFVPRDPNPTPGGTSYVDTLIERILNEALLELGFGDPRLYTQERVKFAAEIALALLAEMRHTSDIMADIAKLKEHLRADVTDAEINEMRAASGAFLEDLAPIAALLSLNQLSLEGIFRQEPDFIHFVDDIVEEAELRTNEAFPLANLVVDGAISEGKLRVLAYTEYPNFSLDMIREGRDASSEILEDLITKTVIVGKNSDLMTKVIKQEQGDHVIFNVEVDYEQGFKTREVIGQEEALNWKSNVGMKLKEKLIASCNLMKDLEVKGESRLKFWSEISTDFTVSCPRRRSRSAPGKAGSTTCHCKPKRRVSKKRSEGQLKFTHNKQAKDIWKEIKVLSMVGEADELKEDSDNRKLKRSMSFN